MKKLFRKNKNLPERKVRTDKKIHVGPTLSIKLKTEVERLAYILDIPIKTLGEALCYEGTHYREVVDSLQLYFVDGQRLSFGNKLYFGSAEHKTLNHFVGEETDRISIRFTQRNYGDIEIWARLLGVTPSRAVAVLIDSAIRNVYIIEVIIRDYNRRKVMSDDLTNELKKFMKFVNRSKLYEDNNWGSRVTNLIKVQRTASIMLDPSNYEWLPGNASPMVRKGAKPRRG